MALIVTLLVIGAVLLLLETILPGLIAGILGVCCLIAGVVLSYMQFGLKTGNMVLFGVMAGLVVGTMIWLRFFPESRVARPFISQGAIGTVRADKPELLNQTGTAHTDLRPAGTAVINGKRVDVVSEGGMIAKGTSIKVVQIEGLRVVVRAA